MRRYLCRGDGCYYCHYCHYYLSLFVIICHSILLFFFIFQFWPSKSENRLSSDESLLPEWVAFLSKLLGRRAMQPTVRSVRAQ